MGAMTGRLTSVIEAKVGAAGTVLQVNAAALQRQRKVPRIPSAPPNTVNTPADFPCPARDRAAATATLTAVSPIVVTAQPRDPVLAAGRDRGSQQAKRPSATDSSEYSPDLASSPACEALGVGEIDPSFVGAASQYPGGFQSLGPAMRVPLVLSTDLSTGKELRSSSPTSGRQPMPVDQ